ncbi:hypothetical protein CLV78_1011056 [Aliiruegeria haliotis]|uniref:Uncharacterized protein n=1 Tax=Aliiruegeria haliotis TaxID=1280846 RepID=A0A2T0S0J2_9RHOB|nr:hypothetical protein [Aliiruegeria haliotis]PRY26951.1 hypothetical protein CLV78_1011056 [Aliiruegeria haliotis]
MTNGILSRHIGVIAIGCGVIGASIYLLMIKVTLAHIEAVSGYVPFDMRPIGYSPADAATLLEALGAEGRAYYLSYQILLDTLYPAALALTLIATLLWIGQRISGSMLVRFGIALSASSALFDYIENLGIVAMIWSWPSISVPLVNAASTATIVKSVITTLAVLVVLLSGIIRTRQPKADLRL